MSILQGFKKLLASMIVSMQTDESFPLKRKNTRKKSFQTIVKFGI